MTLRQLLDIDLPIIQAPMAGAQGSAMAIAVSNAGGLGSLPCAMLSLARKYIFVFDFPSIMIGRNGLI